MNKEQKSQKKDKKDDKTLHFVILVLMFWLIVFFFLVGLMFEKITVGDSKEEQPVWRVFYEIYKKEKNKQVELGSSQTETYVVTEENTVEAQLAIQEKEAEQPESEQLEQEITHSKDAIYRYGEWHEEGTAGYYYELGFDKWSANRDWQGAKVLYAKALEVDPNYTRALCSYGYIIGAFENQFTKGEEYIQKGMQNDPTWAYCPFNLGILKDLQGNWLEAKKWMEFTVTNFANHPDIGHFRTVYSKMKEFHGE